jgi:hypothetical protein
MGEFRMSDSAKIKKANDERKAALKEKRVQQLDDWLGVVDKIEEHLQKRRANRKLCYDLSDHSCGFYEEVNKLAKGKTPLPATPLVRQNANDIISDAKKIVEEREDIQLDRIKEFVPAGDEPSYPDVLIIVRSVRDCLKRHRDRQEASIKNLQGKLRMSATVVGALSYFLDDDEEASDEVRGSPGKATVQAYTKGPISDACFTKYADSYTEYYFDFDKLDSVPPQEYLSALDDDDDDDDCGDEDELLGGEDKEQAEKETEESDDSET